MDGKGKVALVTGSTSGIGLAIALELAKRGCDVIVTGLEESDDTVVDAVKSQISRFNVRVEYIPGDLSLQSDTQRLCEESLKMFPQGVDILVNNAGWGRIINICSQMSAISTPGKSVYSACKTGLVGFTRGVALEAAEFGVTCNAVCPTFTETAILRRQIDDKAKTLGISYEAALKTFSDQIPTKKLCTVEQIVDLVVFMTLSEASSQINGVDYLIDGGYVAQ